MFAEACCSTFQDRVTLVRSVRTFNFIFMPRVGTGPEANLKCVQELSNL